MDEERVMTRHGPDTALRVCGMDAGSAAIKAVILEDDAPSGRPARVLASCLERIRRRDPRAVAEGVFLQCLREAGLERGDLAYVATTGEGEVAPFRTGHFYGMTAHARGALHLLPSARAVLDVGALHARAILVDARARVLGHRMTSQCASGSGQFLENISRYLGITLEEIGPLSLQGRQPEPCSSICAVLAETDVINMVSRGVATPDIIRGIHESMAGRYQRLLASVGARGDVLVTGGLAADVGLTAALTDAAGSSGVVFHAHPDSVMAGALGAALWGAFRHRKLASHGLGLPLGRAS
jgi:benzoyl-CoA reductase subunit D